MVQPPEEGLGEPQAWEAASPKSADGGKGGETVQELAEGEVRLKHEEREGEAGPQMRRKALQCRRPRPAQRC